MEAEKLGLEGDIPSDWEFRCREALRECGELKLVNEELWDRNEKMLFFVNSSNAEIERLCQLIRSHRHSYVSGDDKCWQDNEKLYKEALPEGFIPPERDTLCQLSNCEKYIASCHNPATIYISPQRRIEELEAEVQKLNQELGSARRTIEVRGWGC